MIEQKQVVDKEEVLKSVHQLVEQAEQSLEQFLQLDQKKIDEIIEQMSLAALENHMPLAKAAVRETKRGVYEDKIIKNLFASEYVYHNIKDNKTVGVINGNKYEEMVEIAEPVGVVAGVTPVTNPTSTTIFKALIAIKTRNPIIFAFHPSAQKCSSEAARILRDAAILAGAPSHCIQWIEDPSIKATQALMHHEGVALVLATGGAGMVKSAYSTGKPALGVGPGNVPCYIEKTADVKRAVNDLLLSKTFDNGMICASEQAVIIDDLIYDQVKQELEENQCYFLSDKEVKRLEKLVINEETCNVNAEIVGKSASYIAKLAGIHVPNETKVLLVELEGVGEDYPLSREKLSPVLACYRVHSTEEGITRSSEMLNFGGLGHSAVIHSKNDEVIQQFGMRMKACRIIVNAPSSQGAIGDIYNAYIPSLTLGCGSYGKNSISTNVGVVHLLNIKKVARRRVNMQWFKIPPRIYFEKNSIQYLSQMSDVSNVFIVTDSGMLELGYIDRILHYLRMRPTPV